jgi:hypothetical protein
MPPCAFKRAHWARATTWAVSFWAIDRPTRTVIQGSGPFDESVSGYDLAGGPFRTRSDLTRREATHTDVTPSRVDTVQA